MLHARTVYFYCNHMYLMYARSRVYCIRYSDLGLLYIIVAYLLTAACGTCCLGQHGCRRARRPTRAFLPLVALEALEDGVE